MMNVGANMYDMFYTVRYVGIARANAAIEALPNCGVADKLNQYLCWVGPLRINTVAATVCGVLWSFAKHYMCTSELNLQKITVSLCYK